MMTKLDRGVSLAAIAVIAVALGIGPAQARGGLKAETVELTLAHECGVLEEACDANANVSAVTAFAFRLQPIQETVWTGIAENLLPPSSGAVYRLFNRDSTHLECDGSDDGGADHFHASAPFELDQDGNIPSPTTLGSTYIDVEDTVDICRADGSGGWVLILTGSLKGGAQSGGKNPNK